jgi:hypothetical protein
MADSDSDRWVIVRTVGTEEEAAVIEGYLRAQDVPAQVESLLFHQEPVTFGRLGEVRVRVPPDRADEAERLLAELESPGSPTAEGPAEG